MRVSGGMFRDMTIHDFDMARFIMGEEPVAVFAQGSNLVDPAIGAAGDIDTAFVVLKYASGAMATIVNSRRSAYGYDQRLELHGSQGLLCVGNILENQVQHFGQKGVPVRYRSIFSCNVIKPPMLRNGNTLSLFYAAMCNRNAVVKRVSGRCIWPTKRWNRCTASVKSPCKF